jgi:SAM-dependent methyltransferase
MEVMPDARDEDSPQADSTWESVLACPRCHGEFDREPQTFRCVACQSSYEVSDGIPILLDERPSNFDYQDEVGTKRPSPPERFDLWKALKATDPVKNAGKQESPEGRAVRSCPWLLEIGCGWGSGKRYGVSSTWVGLDLSLGKIRSVRENNASFAGLVATAEAIPFRDGSVPCVLTVAMLEHLDNPERAIAEVDRILAPGGLACHADAFHVPPWARYGVDALSWSNATWWERVQKIRAAIGRPRLVKAAIRIPRRLLREVWRKVSGGREELAYKRLRPIYGLFLGCDEDATVSLDPHSLLHYYRSRGYEILTAPTLAQRVLFGGKAVIARKPG